VHVSSSRVSNNDWELSLYMPFLGKFGRAINCLGSLKYHVYAEGLYIDFIYSCLLILPPKEDLAKSFSKYNVSSKLRQACWLFSKF